MDRQTDRQTDRQWLFYRTLGRKGVQQKQNLTMISYFIFNLKQKVAFL